MSAIWGSIALNGENVAANLLIPKITDYYNINCVINHTHSTLENNFFFGCSVQNLTIEAKSECLPYTSTSHSYCLTADAILDNRIELIKELNITDNSIPDGTLICYAYEKWGLNFIKHLRGLFSIAIYDTGSNTAYLFADQMSARCLYYYYDNNHLSFSTLAAPLRIIHPDIGINDLYIKDFLTAPGLTPNIVSFDTPFENVHLINPGTYLKATSGSIEEISYWTPATDINLNCITPEEYSAYFRALYEQCVRDALRTDGNVGIAMSSGLDSSTVGALAAKFLAKDNKNLYSFTYVPYENTISDKNRKNIHNETEHVQMIHKMYSNIIAEFLNNNGKNCLEDIPECVKTLEMPIKACVNMPNLFEIYKKASSNSCKVVLCGQAGNSTVSHGYIDDILFDLYLNKKYIQFIKYLNNYSKTVKESRRQALKGCLGYFGYARHKYNDSTFSYSPDNPFLAENILEDYPLNERYLNSGTPILGGLPTPGHIYRKYLYLPAMFTYLGALETKVGLTFGIVLRDPTKDMRMLNFCYHLPYHLFAYKGTPRWLIRSSCQDLLPPYIINDWMRYGVQNSDFTSRIIRDWDTIFPKIKNDLSSEMVKNYINPLAVREFISNGTPSIKDKSEITYLLFCTSLYCFLAYYK